MRARALRTHPPCSAPLKSTATAKCPYVGVLKKQEAGLRKILINATKSDRVGDEWIANVSEQKKRLLDREALERHFGTDAIRPFMHDSVSTMLRVERRI